MAEDGLYETPRAALEALTDYPVLERVAVAVLQLRGYPGLVITEATGDLGRDGFVRARFGDHDETVALVTARERWTTKLDEDLDPHLALGRAQRPDTAIFVTSRRTSEAGLRSRQDKALAAGVALDVWGQARLALELEKDDLRALAERELRVRPALPGVLLNVGDFRHHLGRGIPGLAADVVGREDEITRLAQILDAGTTGGRAAVVLVTGPAGMGKTRLAVDVAHDHAATVVAPTSVPLRPEDLKRVPLSEPAVLVVDDAHRSPDMSGVSALLRSVRYDRVSVVLTVRAGLEQAVLGRLGIEPDHVDLLPLRPLGGRDVDEIVLGHGITYEPFRRHVIAASGGVPLVAHMACRHAKDHGSYHPQTTADILRTATRRRLSFLDNPHDQGLDDQRRATAIAVAALAGARNSDRTALAALAPAITSLPPEPDRLDRPLNDLLEAGLIEHPTSFDFPVVTGDGKIQDSGPATGIPRWESGTHVVRPDAVGPVLLADALISRERVRLDMAAVLPLLGRRADFADQQSDARAVTTVLGVPMTGRDDAGLAFRVGELATQLGSLAQAVNLAGFEPGRALLRRAVAELILISPGMPTPNVDEWAGVISLAGQVGLAAPEIVADVRRALITMWPPRPSSSWWPDDEPQARFRTGVRNLVSTIADQVAQLEHLGSERLMPWVLDAAWLAHPVVGSTVREHVLRAAKTLSTTHTARGADSAEAVLARRAALRGAIETWTGARTEGPDDGLPESEQDARLHRVAVLLACVALEPLLSLKTEEVAQIPGESSQFALIQPLLPDSPSTATELDRAVDTVITLLDRVLDPLLVERPNDVANTDTTSGNAATSSAEAHDALKWVVERPRELRAEVARGLGRDESFPDYAANLLHTAADRIVTGIATRWDRLPLATRHAAALAAVQNANIRRLRASGPRARTLVAAAERGDPIAVRASADAELAKVLTLFPVDSDILDELSGSGTAMIPLARRSAQAAALGASLDLPAVITLLDTVHGIEHSMLENFVSSFATAAGAQITDLAPLLAHLERAEQPQRVSPGDACLVRGALANHSDLLCDWLIARVDRDHPELVQLALVIAEDLPQHVAERLHRLVVELLIADADEVATSIVGQATPGVERGHAHAEDPAASSGSVDTETRWTDHEAIVTAACAKSLVRPIGRAGARLTHLCILGLGGPVSAIPQVVASIGHVLDDCGRIVPEGSPSAEDLIAVVRRCLDVVDTRGIRSDHDQYTTVFGIVTLLSVVPSEMALLLYARACTHPRVAVPRQWRELITDEARAGRLMAVAAAFDAAGAELGAAIVADEVEFAIRQMSRMLRGETP
ncbi:AAA family ATPase [Pseudonocardia alni]|uniref:ATP-binding protein n=1 Tax=Pseudonocardia alni TaxID=33907 RepID=UPI003400AC89